jgi:tyrosyl-tRNA synthetase
VLALGRGDVGRDLVDLLAEHGVVGSKGEARRLIAQKGLYLNDVAVEEGRALVGDDLADGRWAMVRRGKKQRHVIDVAPA